MIDGIHAAVSGLRAFAMKIANNAHSVANLNTEGFKKDRVVLSSQLTQGVRGDVDQVEPPGSFAAEQTSRGLEMIEQSNVDLSEEFSDMLLNTHGYEANLKTLQATDEMMRSVLDLKA